LEIIKNILDREAEAGKDISVVLPAKILLLGNHASGKSSLLHYLQNQNLEYNGDSTHLLKIENYPNGKNPNAIFYDFGGQDYYHGIYRAFLSSGSGYLLLWDKDNNENIIAPDSKGLLTQNFKVNYWLGLKKHLESSKYASVQDPILLVQTHAQDTQMPVYLSEHQDDAIQNTFHVSLSDKYNPDKNKAALMYLKAEVDALIESKTRTRNEKEWYVKFYEYVLNEKTVQAISIENLLTYYKPTNKKDNEEILSSLQVELQQFHCQGLVLYYTDIDKNIVWLNPAGLVEYVHEHILQEKLIGEFEGKVLFELFNKVDKNIIALLEKQKVLFKHQFGDNGVEYIVPNFLPLVKINETEYDLFTFGLSNPLFTLKFGQFLPIGLINQLICFFGRQPDKKKFWRDQLLFTFEKKCKVLIRLDFELLEIKVLVSFLDNNTTEHEQIGKYLFYCILAMYWDRDPLQYNEMNSYEKSYQKFKYTQRKLVLGFSISQIV
jgi:internalin A